MRILLFPIAALVLYAAAYGLFSGIMPVDEFKRREITYSPDEYCKRAGMGDVNTVNLFLKKGMKVDSRDKNGATALMRAAENGHAGAVDLILSQKAGMTQLSFYAYLNATDKNGYTALMVAAEGRHAEVIKSLITAGADVNERNPRSGITALMIASAKGDTYPVEALLDGGANVNEADNNGYTALMLAAEKGDMLIVKTLVEHGADREVRNTKWKVGASYIASYSGHKDVAAFLRR